MSKVAGFPTVMASGDHTVTQKNDCDVPSSLTSTNSSYQLLSFSVQQHLALLILKNTVTWGCETWATSRETSPFVTSAALRIWGLIWCCDHFKCIIKKNKHKHKYNLTCPLLYYSSLWDLLLLMKAGWLHLLTNATVQWISLKSFHSN